MSKQMFRGGIHPLKNNRHGKYLSENAPLREIPQPAIAVYPLSQHIGAPCTPVVQKGDDVKVGQLIAQASGFVSTNIYASVSGKVLDIKDHPNGIGLNATCILVENDYVNRVDKSVVPYAPLSELSEEDIINAVKQAGLAGMGGAAFPTHVKLFVPKDKHIDTLILNGAECEPYLTSDDMLMGKKPEDILYGAAAAMKAVGALHTVICIENNKQEAIKVIKNEAKKYDKIEVKSLPVKYPQGAEKQLIYSVTKREVPSGGLPSDVGAVVMNVATAAALGNKLKTGMPLIERIISVSGEGINTPSNLIVRLGTSFNSVIEACDGLNDRTVKVLSGGPMMGVTVNNLDAVVVKGTSGIIALTKEQTEYEDEKPCINCGSCVRVCPMNLMPLRINAAIGIEDVGSCIKYSAMDCIECGACAFVCPAKRNLTQSCRLAKAAIRRKAESDKAKKGGESK